MEILAACVIAGIILGIAGDECVRFARRSLRNQQHPKAVRIFNAVLAWGAAERALRDANYNLDSPQYRSRLGDPKAIEEWHAICIRSDAAEQELLEALTDGELV